MLLRLFEQGFLLLAALFVITQLLIPAIRGTRSFPLFTRERELQNELTDVQQAELEAQLEKTIKEKKEKLPQ